MKIIAKIRKDRVGIYAKGLFFEHFLGYVWGKVRDIKVWDKQLCITIDDIIYPYIAKFWVDKIQKGD